jgi:DNA-directed RNA polymerase subunit L
MATITINRLQWLWDQFSHNNHTHHNFDLQPPSQSFEKEILWLIQRYITILPKKKPKTIQTNNLHHTLHSPITTTLIESFKITHSYYSSPLTCPTQLTQYYSPHNRDKLFGSLGHAQSSRWQGIGLAHPPDHNTTIEAIHWARMAAKEDTNTFTILIVNHNDWTSQQIPITTKDDIHILATISPHTIKYNPTPEWPKYYQYEEPSLVSILCIHGQTNLAPNLKTPHELAHILKHTTHTHIDTYPIKPTSLNYHIKFSKTWRNTPKHNTHTTQITTTRPLPVTYYIQHPIKYHPQQCIYTDGSFIPPTKNLEGQIEGNTAGSGIYSPYNEIQISERLPGYQNILRA